MMHFQRKPLLITCLIGLVCLGAFVRLFNLESVPVILNRDEAALAYNAVLLKEAGVDEFGRSWPQALESFGDFKLPGYVNLVVLSLSIFGQSDAAVRLPSALAGLGLILVGWLWGGFLFPDNREKPNWQHGLVLAGLITVQPIFWFYSRTAFEASVALTLTSLGWWYLLTHANSGQRQPFKDLIGLGFIWWAALVYNTPLLLIPFLLPVIILQRGLKNWQSWLGPIMGLMIIFIGLFSVTWSITAQKSGITIFSDELVWANSVEYRQQFSGPAQTILGNKYVFYGQIITSNLIQSFNPAFVVTRGGTHPWHSLPGWGHLYLLTYLAAVSGLGLAILELIRHGWVSLLQISKSGLQLTKLDRPPSYWWWLYLTFASLAPAVITVDAPHATRSLVFFFLMVGWAGWFLIRLASWLKQQLGPTGPLLFWLAVLLIQAASALQYGQAYFGEYATHPPGSLRPGYDQVLETLNTEFDPDTQVAVVDPDGYHYILTAWYDRTPPTVFLDTIVKQLPDLIGFRYGERFDRYHFIGHRDDVINEDEPIVVYWSNDQWQIEAR